MFDLTLFAAITTLTSVALPLRPMVSGEECYRECIPGDPRNCHFEFDITLYQSMSKACRDCPNNTTECFQPECIPADGVVRKVMVVNRQMPGPHIQVCEGDQIIVDVKNSVPGAEITMHWHGITMKGPTPTSGTPFMDGVPAITQCPITSGTTFRYSFLASNPGTYFYHAHTAYQRGDGVFGPITIRQPPEDDPNINTYDYDLPEHYVMISDWFNIPTEDMAILRLYGNGHDHPDAVLINGHGPYQNPDASPLEASIPYHRFKVTPGFRYRMRLCNAVAAACPIKFSIDDHIFTIIATDGHPVRPFNATSLTLHPGERFDIVVYATSEKLSERSVYWMSYMGGVDGAKSKAHQFSILEYELPSSGDSQLSESEDSQILSSDDVQLSTSDGSQLKDLDGETLLQKLPLKPEFTTEAPPGVQVNTINSGCYDDRVCIADLTSPHLLPDEVNAPKANYTFYLAFDQRPMYNARYYSELYDDTDLTKYIKPIHQVNNISFIPPIGGPLLSKDHRKDDQLFCNIDSPLPEFANGYCDDNYCQCVHMVEVPLGSVVDLVLLDAGYRKGKNHPFHLHGHSFWVLGEDRPVDVDGAILLRQEVIDMDERGELRRNLYNPISKDTITVPNAGYSIVRFKADNPGYWLSHCHVVFHVEGGMALIFKTGEDHEMPDLPHDFPTCGNFKNTGF